MATFDILALLTSLAAIFSWINYRYIRLPNTIGLMVLTLALSLSLVALGRSNPAFIEAARSALQDLDFDRTLLHGMLGAMLFAGALHLNLNDLSEQRAIVGALATLGVVLSTAIVGVLSWAFFRWLQLGVPFTYCLLFGALISPTDPIAVGAILRRLAIPHPLMTTITGESLFNDGVGVVVFLTILGAAEGSHGSTLGRVVNLLAVEAVGGIVYGLVVGWIVYRMLRAIDNYQVEVLLTLALVTGGYSAAHVLHVSGPLAMVVAGLMIGNHGRRWAMSKTTREHLDSFWELVDEFLNALLFVMIGAEVLVIGFPRNFIVAGLASIPVVLIARALSVGGPVAALLRPRHSSPHIIKILTWSGLRGGISVALALSLPHGPGRDVVVASTFVVVVFSILVQGLTVGRFVAWLFRNPHAPPA